MLDIKFVREHADEVKENIKRKFQEKKLPLVDEVIELDKKIRSLKAQGDELRQERNVTSDEIGSLFREKRIDEANAKKLRVVEINESLVNIEKEEAKLSALLKEKMMAIPNMIAADVPIGEDDSMNHLHTAPLLLLPRSAPLHGLNPIFSSWPRISKYSLRKKWPDHQLPQKGFLF